MTAIVKQYTRKECVKSSYIIITFAIIYYNFAKRRQKIEKKRQKKMINDNKKEPVIYSMKLHLFRCTLADWKLIR